MSKFAYHTGKIPKNAKKVKDDKGNTYKSLGEAGKQFPNPDCARRAISDVCKGKRDSYRGVTFWFI